MVVVATVVVVVVDIQLVSVMMLMIEKFIASNSDSGHHGLMPDVVTV